MKKNRYIILACALIGFSLSSCLKDETALDPDNSVNVTEFKNPSDFLSPYGSKYALYNIAFDAVEEIEYNLTVSYSGAHTAPQDIVVTFDTDPAALDQYMEEQGEEGEYTNLPSDLFTLPSSVTIPSGGRTASVPIKFRSSSFDFDENYVLPIRIASVSYGEVSGNFGTILISVAAKNAYDGIYSVEEGSYVQRYSSPDSPTIGDALNGSLVGNPNVTLTTVGATTVQIGNMRWAGGSSGVAGIDNTRATVDPSTNQVIMSSLGNATVANWAGRVNQYDPATRTFTLNFDWNQTGAKREMTLILRYVGPRE